MQHCLERVLKAKTLTQVVVAAPHKIPLKLQVPLFIGDEHDVLKRYYDCAREYKADVIVRITADCPLIDSEAIDIAVNYFLRKPFEYVCFAPVDGLDVEVFTMDLLRLAHKFVINKYDKEHVTPYMRRVTKLSVDTIHDLEKVKRDYELYK